MEKSCSKWTVAISGVLFATSMSMACSTANAQSYPGEKPIRVITGLAAGGQSDIAVRLIGKEMSSTLGQSVVIDARPGAGQTIGASASAKAAPDGYTIFFGGTGSHPLFVKNNAVDLSKEMTPVSNSARGLYVLYSTAKLPHKTLKDLVDYSKANPGQLNFGTSTPTLTLIMQVLNLRTGINFVVIPYKGADQTSTALRTGEVGMTVASAGPLFRSMAETGAVHALLAFSETRSVLMPGVVSAGELGMQAFDSSYSVGFWAPLGTPRNIVQTLSSAAAEAARKPAISEEFRKNLGFEAIGSTPEELLRSFQTEIRFWTEAARLSKFEPQ